MERLTSIPMIKNLSVLAAFAYSVILASPPVLAVTGKAPCGSFQKLSDGKWNVVKPIKIEHGEASVMLKPGTSIGPGTRVVGVDIYAALQKNCQQAGDSQIGGGRQ
jgi:hypothetical protein